MGTHSGALINKVHKLSTITDGTSKTLMLTEVRTRDHQRDPRGVWATAWTAGSIIAYDMHPRNPVTGDVDSGCGQPPRVADMPYVPMTYPGVDCHTPNSKPTGNADRLRECPESNLASLENMPCAPQGSPGTWTSAAPRSNHPGGVIAANCDGSVRWLDNEI